MTEIIQTYHIKNPLYEWEISKNSSDIITPIKYVEIQTCHTDLSEIKAKIYLNPKLSTRNIVGFPSPNLQVMISATCQLFEAMEKLCTISSPSFSMNVNNFDCEYWEITNYQQINSAIRKLFEVVIPSNYVDTSEVKQFLFELKMSEHRIDQCIMKLIPRKEELTVEQSNILTLLISPYLPIIVKELNNAEDAETYLLRADRHFSTFENFQKSVTPKTLRGVWEYVDEEVLVNDPDLAEMLETHNQTFYDNLFELASIYFYTPKNQKKIPGFSEGDQMIPQYLIQNFILKSLKEAFQQ